MLERHGRCTEPTFKGTCEEHLIMLMVLEVLNQIHVPLSTIGNISMFAESQWCIQSPVKHLRWSFYCK